MSIYLDYNASAPIDPRVLEEMIQVYQNKIGNADSRTHDYGENARAVVENARKQTADLLRIQPNEVYFTGGATESNNIAIRGLYDYAVQSGKKHMITTTIEHKAVLESARAMEGLGFEVDYVAPERDGRVSVEKIIEKVKDTTLLVSVMHVNNETGIIQPVDELGRLLKQKKILFHVDATQSCGKLVPELQNLDYNMLSFSAHKLCGPQGIGVLVLRKNGYRELPVKPILYGGQQERGIRPGTVPVALAAGCGRACELALQEYEKNTEKTKALKNLFCSLVENSGLSFSYNGEQKHCLDTTANICFHGVNSEALMLSAKQYCSISNGSACTSKSYSPSYVLKAMGKSDEEAESSVRISWGPQTDTELFQEGIIHLLDIAKRLVF